MPYESVTTNAHLKQEELHHECRPLDAMFAPRSIAVIGATEEADTIGRKILWNLVSNPLVGTVFAVSPDQSGVPGVKTYPNIGSIPQKVDLAMVVLSAPMVPGAIAECVEAGVKGAIVISSGFKECGDEGAKLEQGLLEEIQRGKMRLIGPNCLGVMRPSTGLNATFARSMARPGNVGFISQSGALCTAILDWSLRMNLGFSAFISIGSMLDVGWGDLIYYLGDDPKTKSIVIYMESIGDARSFVSAAREVAYTKPIIVIKAGRTEAGAKAAASHTGALTGTDMVLDAAFRRCGVLRVDSIAELFYMAEVLAKQPRPEGPRLTIITNAGGPAVLATDALIKNGGALAQLSQETVDSLNQFLPLHWSHRNPVDILDDADPDRYTKTLDIASKDPNSDGLLVILTPQARTDPTRTSERLKPCGKNFDKPLLASWMGGAEVEPAVNILNNADVPTFPYPDTAARIFMNMWRYTYNLRGLYETPMPPFDSDDEALSRQGAEKIITHARSSGRTSLTEHESKQVLAAYGIPTVETRIAASEEEAVKIAGEIGYPVVLKVHSEAITHKSAVGGVQLNLANPEAVRRAFSLIGNSVLEKVGDRHFSAVTVQPMVKFHGYELIVGSGIDSQFGPVIIFGTGGQPAEHFKDQALALPPLNTTLARRMMEQTRIYEALKRAKAQNSFDVTSSLEQLLVRFSQLVVEQRLIKGIDMNPLLASPEGLIVLDANIVLHQSTVSEAQLPKLAIRPYPTQYIKPWTMKDGTEVTIRPIRPEDEPWMVKFHEQLSDQSVYFRYFHPVRLNQRITHERLARICFIDYDREMVLVVDHKDPATGDHEIIAAGRLNKMHNSNDAEFAILVSDQYQRRGLGTELLNRLIKVGREEKIDRVIASMLPENRAIQSVCRRLGFHLHYDITNGVVKAEIDLRKG
ncbi:MAG: bifunctional acetate--CoA ligase family protein/GNAT family N-acetyltransferase [bacterium]